MKKLENSQTKEQLIADSFLAFQDSVLSYVYFKTGNKQDAEDLTQDTFLKLMDYEPMLRNGTVKYFIFTIAKNLVKDYYRHRAVKAKVSAYIFDHTTEHSNETENLIIARDLEVQERAKIALLPPQRKTIYMMSRFQEIPAADIANQLNLSQRTVENHLLLGRKDVREHIKKCI